MQPALILTELERVLPAADLPVVLAALKEDELVWSTLQNEEFVRTIIATDCSTPAAWSPASLALKPLGERIRLADLTADNLPVIDGSLRKQASELLDLTIKNGTAAVTLTDAGLIALALRERRRKMQSWHGIYDALTSMHLKSGQNLFDTWKTPLACLYSIIPDGAELLASLLSAEILHPGIEWVSHVLLSNPIDPETRVDLFLQVMAQYSLEHQVEWLRFLKRKGYSSLVIRLAGKILAANGNAVEVANEEFDVDRAEWSDMSAKVLRDQVAGTLHQLAGHPMQAAMHLERARGLLQHWLAGSTIQVASIIRAEGSNSKAKIEHYAQTLRQFTLSPNLTSESGYVFSGGAQPFSLTDLNTPASPILAQMEQAKQLAESGSTRQAQEIAYGAVQEWLKAVDENPSLLTGQFVFEMEPWVVLNQLVELGLYVDAVEVGEKYLTVRREDTELMVWLSDQCHRIGEDDKAVDYIYQVTLLDPGNAEIYRKLAGFYEDRKFWDKAVDIRKRVLEIVPLPALDDQVALAKCAFGGKEFDLMNDTCQKILAIDPDHGLGLTYLGMARLANGDNDNGLAYLNKATLSIPENPLPWIQLAEAYKSGGESQRALETLRAAIITAPESAELHFAVGATCLETGLTAEALPFLRQSARLAPESDRVGLALAATLLKLGHEPEALQVIEKTRASWPAHPELAYLHAKILLDKKDIDRGLSILEIALQSDEPNPSWFILYVNTLINAYDQDLPSEMAEVDKSVLLKAHKMIQKAVTLASESFEAKLLLAELLSLRGEQEASYAAYLQIVELTEAAKPEWSWRVQAGLGKTALALQQTETAVASLQNAVNANPESLNLQRYLSRAYRQAKLYESAQSSAKAALALAPDDVPNLIWFADFMNSIESHAEAVDALSLARQISPERLDLAILLAQALNNNGDFDACRDVLAQADESGKATVGELRQIAHTYLRLGDDAQALSCLERVIAAEPDGAGDFLHELATLYAKTDQLDKALDTIQKAIHENPRRVEYYLFQSEIQDRSNRPQAALASLEHVLRLVSADTSAGIADIAAQECVVRDLVNVHMRFAQLLQKVENYASASYHAEKALELTPDNLEIRYMAVELAMKQMLYERASSLAEVPEFAMPTGNLESEQDQQKSVWLAGIACLRAEMAFDRNDDAAAIEQLEIGLALAPQHPRLMVADLLLRARSGDFKAANDRFDEIKSTVARAMTDIKRGVPLSEPVNQPTVGVELLQALATAAIELRRFKDALALEEKYTGLNPCEPQGLFRYAQAMVEAAEWHANSETLRLQSHVAPETALSEVSYGKFSQLISEAGKFSSNGDIERWKVRGEAIFHPNTGNVRSLANLQAGGEDARALVQALSRLGNLEAARQLGTQYPDDANVCLQLSLLDLPSEPAYLLEKAQRSAAIEPENPIHHVAMARALEESGEYDAALESLTNALFYWPEEGLWQAWAGALAARCGDPDDACEHYEVAYALLPESIEIAVGLGKGYLATGKPEQAIEVFSKAVKDAPEKAELWQYLAETQFASGSQREALVSAETAARLDPGSSPAKVLCGEIAFALGNEGKAQEMIQAALKLDPTNVRVRLLSAKILSSKGKDKESLAEINKAVEILPDAVELQAERARLVYKLHGAAEAMKLLLPLAKIFPNNEHLLALQARTNAEVGDFGQAESSALQSIRLNPAQPILHRLLGNIYRQTGQLDKSVHHLSEAARMSPCEAEAYLELGEVYTCRREYPQALTSFEQAMKAAPDDHRPYYQSALVLRDGKDYQGAESMMRRAAQLAPNDVNIRRQLGAIVALNLVQSCQEANTCQ